MLRYLLIGTGNFLKRMDFYALIGTFLALLGVVLPLIPNQYLYAFFSFRNASQLVLYIAGILAIFVVAVFISQILGIILVRLGRNIEVNVTLEEYLQTHSDPKYFSLKIVNNEKDDLTECRARLISAEQFYNPTAIDILDAINPNDSLMSWGGGSKSEYVTIPGDGGRKVLNVAYHGGGGRLIFPFYEWTSRPQLANVVYHVVIKIDGRLDGEPFKAKKYEGFFRSVNYISPLTPVSSGRMGKDGEFIEERTTTYGGTPETRLEFVRYEAEKNKGINTKEKEEISSKEID